MSIVYARHHERIMEIFEMTETLVRTSSLLIADALLARLEGASQQFLAEAPLRIALIGEFSAGKSSVVAALTGEQLNIDADVSTTDITPYPWNGVILVDTPGVKADSEETDHDRIAKQATIDADLVLFVISNELFSPRLASHLQYVLADDGLGLSRKTSIIVNKIDREVNPDESLILEISKVLGPHQEVPIYFCSASKYRQAQMRQSPLKERFLEQSRFRDLIRGIDSFVDDAGLNGRLSTPLTIVGDCLDQIQSALVETKEDRDKIELIRRQRRILQQLQRRLAEIRKAAKHQVYSTVFSQGNQMSEELDVLSKPDDLDRLLEVGLAEAEGRILQIVDGMGLDVNNAIEETCRELEGISGNQLSISVSTVDAQKAERIKVAYDGSRPIDSAVAMRIVRATGEPLQNTLQAAAADPKRMRDIYYKVGKKLGKNFERWEAVKAGRKIAAVAGKAAKAMPYLCAALSYYMEYREEKELEARQRHLADLRLTLRGAFADQARGEADAVEIAVTEATQEPLEILQRDLDLAEEELSAKLIVSESMRIQVIAIRRACAGVRDEIYSGQSQQESPEEMSIKGGGVVSAGD